jgi:hypothetical protein
MAGAPRRGVWSLALLSAIGCFVAAGIFQFRSCARRIAARNTAYQARTGVRALALAVRQLLADGKMPATAEWTPKALPCEQPGHYLPLDTRDWQSPPWSELEFQPTLEGDDVPLDGIYYQFRVSRPQPGQFVVEARGDLDCDGVFGRYAIRVTRDATSPIEEPADLRE